MIICIGQTKPIEGDIAQNLEIHKRFLNIAIDQNADILIFPELSLTGYEPHLASELATTQADKRLDYFQEQSNLNNIIIGVGLPTKLGKDLFISMVIFQPHKERITYSKQHLYPSESAIFTAGKNQVYLKFGQHIIAPAICYELSIPEHSELAFKNKATIYIASVLNSVNGIDSDIEKLAIIAQKYKMTVLMTNFIGSSGGYDCAGKSSVWNKEGIIIGQMDDKTEGVLFYNTETEAVSITIKIELPFSGEKYKTPFPSESPTQLN